VRFWDSSAVIPLLVSEAATAAVVVEYERDPDLIVWWATEVECESALARRERDGPQPIGRPSEPGERLTALATAWQEIQPITRVRDTARRLLRVHPLRASDAMQLAAAIAAALDDPRSLPFVTLDDRLALAADKEGFPVVRPIST
jgi:uncharacterized protein